MKKIAYILGMFILSFATIFSLASCGADCQHRDADDNSACDICNEPYTDDKDVVDKYTVVWKNYDDTVLETDIDVESGTVPSYDGTTPQKSATAENTYTFAGWSPSVSAVTGNITYIAEFSETVNKYTVTWKNWDDSVLEVDLNVEYGAIPSYDGSTPTKTGNTQYTYTFSGWDKAKSAVTGDITYVAQFASKTNTYTVTWQNWDGSVLEVYENVLYGTMPGYNGSTPTKDSDAQYTYTFSGWTPTVDTVSGDVTYVAQFTNEVNKYTVTWRNQNGALLERDENVPYGTEPTYNGETPTKDSLSYERYIFSGWSPTVNIVTGNVTYYAQFTSEPTKFTVTWTNWDGTVLEVDENVPYGATPTYDGITPSRTSDEEYNYTFSSWGYVSSVWRDVVYTAQFSYEFRKYTVTWKNWDGSVLSVEEFTYGWTPWYHGETPTRPHTDTEAFDFVGWDKDYAVVEGDQTYVATFNGVQIYQIKYNLDGGSCPDIENTYKRIDESFYLTNSVPTKEGYRFVGWNNIHESRIYEPGDYFDTDFDVEFWAVWERYELCSDCSGNGYTTTPCTDCDGKGEWDTTCTGGFTMNGYHYEGTKCPNCGTKYGFVVINGIGDVCSSCYSNYGRIYQGKNVICTICSGSGKIHHTCTSCEKLGYIANTCTSCEGSKGIFEEPPVLSYKTTTKVELVYIEGYEYSKDGFNWQSSPLFENLAIHTQYTFYQRRASTETVPFGPTSTSLVVTTDDYYSVTYVLNGGDGHRNTDEYADNDQIVLQLAYKTGYTSLGWFDEDGNKIEVLGNGMTGNLVLYAEWNDGNQYTISFDVRGADFEIEPMTVQYKKEFTLPTPTKDGYDFKGWYFYIYNGDGSINSWRQVNNQGTWTTARDMELFAIWDAIEYPINYVLNGGSISGTGISTTYTIEGYSWSYSSGGVIHKLVPERTGYTFIGWFDEQGNEITEIAPGTKGPITVIAKWNDGNTYLVNLDSGCSDVADDTIELQYDHTYSLPTLEREHHVFIGWYNGENKISNEGVWKYTIDKLVAKWAYELTDGVLTNANSNLTVLIIPEGVTSIGDNAFSNCTNLTRITIPSSVISIGEKAFYGCSSLTSVTFDEGSQLTSIGDYAFSDIRGLTSIIIPGSVESIGERAFSNCTGLKSLTISDGVTSIGSFAFQYCDSLTSVTIPDSVTNIGDSAFYSCDSLTIYCVAASEPSGWNYYWNYLNSESNYSFYCPVVWDCLSNDVANDRYIYVVIDGIRYGIKDNVATVVRQPQKTTVAKIPSSISYNGKSYSITRIDSDAFYGCTGLTSVTIPDSVTGIGNYAFSGCKGLTSVTIGNGVTSIGDHAFADCTALEIIYFNAKLMDDLSADNYAFPNAGKNGPGIQVIVGSDVERIPSYLFFPSTTWTSYYPKITSIEFEKGSACQSIGLNAFAWADSLKNVYYAGTQEQWNSISIEYGNSDLKNATIVYNYDGE